MDLVHASGLRRAVRTAGIAFDGRQQGQGRTVVADAVNRWALRVLFDGTPLEELVEGPFQWRPGWEYVMGG